MRILGRKVLYSAPHYVGVSVEQVEVPDGHVIDDYQPIATGEFVTIVGEAGDKRVLTLRQYRHGVRRTGLALPRGRINDGEAPLVAAKRELHEETGTEPRRGHQCRPGTRAAPMVLAAAIFHATGLRRVRAPASADLEGGELIELRREDVRCALRTGEFVSIGQAMPLALLSKKGCARTRRRSRSGG